MAREPEFQFTLIYLSEIYVEHMLRCCTASLIYSRFFLIPLVYKPYGCLYAYVFC